jgi:hypothetical protein
MSNTLAKILGQGGGGIDVWASGKTIQQYDFVISPADLEIYQRKTATGSGTTDPFLDKTNYRPASIDRIASITNAWSGGTPTADANAASYFNAQTIAVAPSLTAGVRTTVLSLTGRGALRFAAWTINASSVGTLKYEIEVDGNKVFDATYAASSAARYAIGVGSVMSNASGVVAAFDHVDFSSSCQIFATIGTTATLFQFKNAYVGYQS